MRSDRPQIREAWEDGEPIRAIARRLNASRNTIRAAIRPGSRDAYYRASRSEAAEAAVREVLAQYPRMQTRDIGALVRWELSESALYTLVRRLRPEYRDAEPSIDAGRARGRRLAAQRLPARRITP